MTLIHSSDSKFVSTLASISGMKLLTVFWVIGAATVFGVTIQGPLLKVFVLVIELTLAVIWLGYPVVLYYCFARGPNRVVIVLLLVLAVIIGYAIGAFSRYINFQGISAYTISLVELLLIVTVFFTGAYALRMCEKRAHLQPHANIFLTTLALFAFPIFGAYIHNRFRQAVFK